MKINSELMKNWHFFIIKIYISFKMIRIRLYMYKKKNDTIDMKERRKQDHNF